MNFYGSYTELNVWCPHTGDIQKLITFSFFMCSWCKTFKLPAAGNCKEPQKSQKIIINGLIGIGFFLEYFGKTKIAHF